APRLYLPAITGHQIRSGQRKFEVLSGNLKALRVTAQLVAPADAAPSIAAFKKYDREGGDSEEMYQPLPAGLIRGKKIFERTIEILPGALDARQQTTLDWNEILGAQKAGVILLTVEGEPRPDVAGKHPGAQALIELTDLGVLWKKIAEGLRVTIFSMATGRPIDGAKAALLDTEFAETGRGATNAEGTVTLPLPANPGWLVVTQGDDVHALRIGQEGRDLPMAAFRVPIDYNGWGPPGEKKPELRALIFTDRPLYRPGETVHVKGIVRDESGDALTVRAGLEGTLKLINPRGAEISETEVRTDERGAFDAEIALSTVTTGAYSLQLGFREAASASWQRGFHCKFEVADYQPNAFELDLSLPRRLAPGAEVATRVTAKYLFGAPLTKADARWTLRYVREMFEPEGFENWHFGDEDNSEGKILTLRGAGAFAGAEGFSIQPQLPEVKDVPYRGVLTVEVTDINQQTVSESRLFVRDAAEFYLGLAVEEGVVFRPGEAIPVQAVAVNSDGTPRAQPVEVSAELVRVRFETVRVQGAGKAISFRSEKVEEVVAKATGRTLLPTQMNQAWQVRDGASVSFKSAGAGQYRVRMTAKDSAGREVTSVLPLYVTGAAEISWDYRNPAQLDLVTDKTEYRPGDTARILIKTPISGEALVTVERGERILRTMRVKLEGNAPAIEIPLEKTDAPNVFVSMVLIRGREQSTRKFKTPEYRYGVAMLRVSDPTERLQVEIAAARPEVQPGEEVDAEVRIRDGAGTAVAGAEVTFFAVDDGVLAITGYERPAPGPIFAAPFSLAVRTGLTLFELLPEDPADLEFSNKGYLIGGGGLEGPGLKLRRDFPGTACWFPSLRTDAAGKVRVRFSAPDAITRYRLVAVAHASAKLFGSGESAFAIRKPLVLLSALGQFANVGDELLARAVVRNDTGADATAEVSLQLDATAEPTKPGPDALRAKVAVPN
ncbi:MAG: MG2 domain-containing protein, partial [Chthoniobacteraceae bacterium]